MRVPKQIPRRLADHRVVENRRVAPGELPGAEERRPVDVGGQLVQREVVEGAVPQEGRRWRLIAFPSPGERPPNGFLVGAQWHVAAPFRHALAGALVVLGNVRQEAGAPFVGHQRLAHADAARSVRDVDHRLLPGRGDLRRGVRLRGRGAADQQGNGHAAALHLARHVYHLVQGRRDQAGEAHHVRADFLGGVENALGRRHHAEVVDLEVVALQHHADDVLADVVDVALHRGEHDLAGAARFAVLLRFDERHEMRHRPLHHPGALHHLRQEHLADAEQVADGVHAVHQRPLDHVDGPRRGQPRLLGIVDDVAVDAFHQRMAQPFGDRPAAPLGVVRRGCALPGAAVALRRLEQALGGVGAAIQHRVLHRVLEVGGNLVVDGELAGVDDAHGQPGVDGVVEEDRVDGFAHAVVAAKRERDVADAAGGMDEREALLRPAHGVDEVAPVAVVFVDAGGDGEDVGVEHDVFRREVGLFHQQPVAAFDDLLAPRKRVGLAAFVEGHHHRRGAVAPA